MPQPEPFPAIPDYLPEGELFTSAMLGFDRLMEISVQSRRTCDPNAWEPRSHIERELFNFARTEAIQDIQALIDDDEMLSEPEKKGINRIIALHPLLHSNSASAQSPEVLGEIQISMAFEIRNVQNRWVALTDDGVQIFQNPVVYEVCFTPGKSPYCSVRLSEAAYFEACAAFQKFSESTRLHGEPDHLYDCLWQALNDAASSGEDSEADLEIRNIRCLETPGTGIVETQAGTYEFRFSLGPDAIVDCRVELRDDPFILGHQAVTRSYADSALRPPASEAELRVAETEKERLRNMIERNLQRSSELPFGIRDIQIRITQPLLYYSRTLGLQIDFLVEVTLPDGSYVGFHDNGEIEIHADKLLMSCSPRTDKFYSEFLYSSLAFVEATTRALDALTEEGGDPCALADEIQEKIEEAINAPLARLQFRRRLREPDDRAFDQGYINTELLFRANGIPVSISLAHAEGSAPEITVKRLEQHDRKKRRAP